MRAFEEGDGTTAKKPRRTNFPQQQYACSCHTMRMYRGDLLSLTCKDCKANGAAIADSCTCKCVCRTGIFFEKDIQKMAALKLRADELKARRCVPDTDAHSVANFGRLLAGAFRDGVASLTTSKSEHNENNIFSSAAGHLSRLQMLSEEELHSLQQRVPLSTRLRATGRDIRDATNADPWKKGKCHNRNNLRYFFSIMHQVAADTF
jgi:hypothetical protein